MERKLLYYLDTCSKKRMVTSENILTDVKNDLKNFMQRQENLESIISDLTEKQKPQTEKQESNIEDEVELYKWDFKYNVDDNWGKIL